MWATRWQNQQSECAPSEDSDQPGHPPSLIRVFAVRMKKAWVLSYPLIAQRRLWSDWADAQADLSLRWAHTHFVDFVMSRLMYSFSCILVFRQKQLWCISLNMRYFINFTLTFLNLQSRTPLKDAEVETFDGKWHKKKLTSKRRKKAWRHARESFYTLMFTRRYFLAPVSHM